MGLVMAGAALIGAGVGLYQSWQASETAAKLDADTQKRVGDALKIYEQNVKLPAIDRTPLTQEQMVLLGKYTPKVAQYIQEKAPEMVTEQASADLINKQKDALQQYQQLSQTGEDALSVAQREQGMAQAAGEQQKNQAAILHQYQNQGVAQGGQGILASQNAGQQADTQRRQLSLDVAAQNQQRRLAALGQMTGLAGQMRGQNQNVEQANVSAINAFNQRNAMTKQAWENQQAQTQNNAQQYNLEAAQNIANQNTGIANQTNIMNRQRQDMIEAANRNAANEMNTNKLNATLGQAATNRSMGQDELFRQQALQQQALGTVANAANTYSNNQQRSADRAAYGTQPVTATKAPTDLDTSPYAPLGEAYKNPYPPQGTT